MPKRKRISSHFVKIKIYILSKLGLFLKIIIDYFSKIELRISTSEKIINDVNIEDLTANIDNAVYSEQVKTYLNALTFAVKKPNIINIALTGGFGSGKSTIINQFCKINRGNHYLHISLANFKAEESDEKVIETSIVQQILYFEKKAIIKESSYRRIEFTHPLQKIFSIFVLLMWIYTIIFLFFENINAKFILFKYFDPNYPLIYLIFVGGTIYFLYNSFDKIKNITFSKMTPSSLEIVNEKTDKELSVFNRNIDEIIYFFEKTDTNVVIVEDIDRFKDDIAVRLYSKIREISILINQSKDVSQNVKFIYSVKDELILEDKTKFFDIIIPVIPITDYSNSKNIFLSKLECFFEQHNDSKSADDLTNLLKINFLDKNFIAEVSYYVYDMRTVINICNEFKLYHKIQLINKPDIDSNKLFAMILYKNVFPSDFAAIQRNISKLHEIFGKNFDRHFDLSSILNDIDNEYSEISASKKELEKKLQTNLLDDVKELRTIYAYKTIFTIQEKHKTICRSIEGIDIGEDFVNDESFCNLINSKNIKYRDSRNTDISSNVSFEEIEALVNSDLKYIQREQLIEDSNKNLLNNFNSSLRNLNFARNEIKSLSILELSSKYGKKIDDFLENIFTMDSKVKVKKGIFLLNKPANFGLFRFLILNDYINEDFIEYISYFHKGSLSHNDNNLVIKINQNNPTLFEENIDGVEDLIENIRDNRFKNSSVIIFDILHFLIDNYGKSISNKNKLQFIYDQLKIFDENAISFIENFLKRIESNKTTLSKFYNEIITWDNFWSVVEKRFVKELREKVLIELFQFIKEEDFSENVSILNKNNLLTQYINHSTSFLQMVGKVPNNISIIPFFKILKIQIVSVPAEEEFKELVLNIYRNNLYEINISNVHLFSKIDKSFSYNEKLFFTSNFTFLQTQQESLLFKLIMQNLEAYINNVYLKMERNRSNDISSVLFLIADDQIKLSSDIKSSILNKGCEGKLSFFPFDFKKELIEMLLDRNLVTSNWDNLVLYYGIVKSINEITTKFLNEPQNYINLNAEAIYIEREKLFGEGFEYKNYLIELINCEFIDDKAFKSIFSNSTDLFLNPAKIDICDRLNYLISLNFIEFNDKNFIYLQNNGEVDLILFIEQNEKLFNEKISTYHISIETLELMLHSQISYLTIKKIIQQKSTEILKAGSDFFNKLSSFYLENKVIDYDCSIFFEFSKSSIKDELKIELFNQYSVNLDNSEIVDFLSLLNGNYISIVNKIKVEFPDTPIYKKFLSILKEREFIRRIYTKKDNLLSVSFLDLL